jgi:hypothetical protein
LPLDLNIIGGRLSPALFKAIALSLFTRKDMKNVARSANRYGD